MQAERVPSGERARPRNARRRRIARRGWVTIAIAVVLLLAGGTMVAARLSGGYLLLGARAAGIAMGVLQPKLNTPGTTGSGTITPVVPQEPFSVLVLGTEQAPADAGPQLTDSMMVMSFDPQSKTASLMSIPRDLYVDVPHFGHDRINTAYENGGVDLAKLTVEKYFGVPIEYYAIVNYDAFVQLVDAVGGVDVVVPPGVTGHGIYDPTYPNPQENQNTLFQLAAGPQHLDGATALKFIRERHSFANGDFTRQADQQQVLLALKSALISPANWVHFGSIMNDVFNAVQTNVPYHDMPRLAAQVLQLPKTSIQTAVLTNAVTDATINGGDVLIPNASAIHQAVAQNFAGLLQPMGQLTVQVLNGTPSAAPLATDFTDQVLQPMGVQTLPGAPADRTDYKDNEVIVNTSVYTPGRGQPIPTEAYMLGQMLSAQVQEAPFPNSQAQIVVILGSAFPPMQ